MIENNEQSDSKLNTILYGPPGTGKTYRTVKMAYDIIEPELNQKSPEYKHKHKWFREELANENGQIAFITFHQSYGYEEFIEGIRPVISKDKADNNNSVKYTIKDGIFKEFCEKARKNKKKKYVFIIDEINRGNISKIFGELITLIEDTKRDGKGKECACTILPYSGTPFSIPDNVYIIGTMNTADRSIALLDTALRRRFDFVEMQADYNLLKKYKINNKQIKLGDVLEKINNQIELEYDRDHTIGHSEFLKVDSTGSLSPFADLLEYKILPVLQEYFYSDYEKIGKILNGCVTNLETDMDETIITAGHYKFITDDNQINKEAFKKIRSLEYIDSLKKGTPINDYGKYNGCYSLMNTVMKMYSEHIQDMTINSYDIRVLLWLGGISTQKSREAHPAFNLDIRYGHSGLYKYLENKEIKKEFEDGIDKIFENHFNSTNKQIGLFKINGEGNIKCEDTTAKEFVQLCIDIYNEDNPKECYEKVYNFKKEISHLKQALISQILHCIKPTVFPPLNSWGINVYDKLGVKINADKTNSSFETYAKKCQKINDWINDFREKTDYRTIDTMFNDVNQIYKNTLLYGPPDTGKTYNTAELAVKICLKQIFMEEEDAEKTGNNEDGTSDDKSIFENFNDLKRNGRIGFVTFHQSYGYEEFIEGIRPVMQENDDDKSQLSYEYVDGAFKSFCVEASRDPENNYVFIIDEINRGNISKIFGEAITLIEDKKRSTLPLESSGRRADKKEYRKNNNKNTKEAAEAAEVILPYTGDRFRIPQNVYIIGTMNTADRSIALMDIALRRRFVSEEVMPDPSKLCSLENSKKIELEKMLTFMNEKIETLLDREHTIGHAYFMGLKKESKIEELVNIFKYRIIPLLMEYFYNDFDKIKEVIGDSFISGDGEKNPFRINYEALKKPDSYINIYKKNKG